MTKLKSAPNLLKQPQGATECKIFVGRQAWDFAKAPQAERSQAEIDLNQVLPTWEFVPPIVLDAKFLENPTAYHIAPATVRYIELHRANNAEPLAANIVTVLCDLIAQQTEADTVILFDEAGQTLEDLSSYIHRLRTDSETQQRAKLAADSTKTDEQRRAEFTELFGTMGDNEKLAAFMAWHNKPIYYHEQLESLYHYTGQKWEAVEDVAMGRLIRNFFLENGITKYNASRIEKMLNLFKYEAERMGRRDPNLLAFANGILHKQTGEFMPHAKEHFLTSFINIDYFASPTPTPNFDKWLNWVSDGKAEKRDRILAALYMILTNRYEWQLFLEITGEGGTGKSIFNHLAKILAGGEDNTAAFSLKDLESPTMRCGLIDKTLCYSPDQRKLYQRWRHTAINHRRRCN